MRNLQILSQNLFNHCMGDATASLRANDRGFSFNYDSFASENKTMITKDIPSNIPRNIRNNFLKNDTFNHDSFASENKTIITKDIPSNISRNIPRNIPRYIHNNFRKNNTFNYDSFALENKTMIHMVKHSLNSRRISIKLLECVQKIFLIFSQPFFEGYPSKKWIFLGIFLFILCLWSDIITNAEWISLRLESTISNSRELPKFWMSPKSGSINK